MLQVASQRAIANILKIKEALVTELVAWIQSDDQSPEDAARVLGVNQLGIADLLNKRLTTFTVDALINMLCRSGKNIQISVR